MEKLSFKKCDPYWATPVRNIIRLLHNTFKFILILPEIVSAVMKVFLKAASIQTNKAARWPVFCRFYILFAADFRIPFMWLSETLS